MPDSLTRFRKMFENLLPTVKTHKSLETPQIHPDRIRTQRQWGKSSLFLYFGPFPSNLRTHTKSNRIPVIPRWAMKRRLQLTFLSVTSSSYQMRKTFVGWPNSVCSDAGLLSCNYLLSKALSKIQLYRPADAGQQQFQRDKYLPWSYL